MTCKRSNSFERIHTRWVNCQNLIYTEITFVHFSSAALRTQVEETMYRNDGACRSDMNDAMSSRSQRFNLACIHTPISCRCYLGLK
jgi:hypothetical protein